MNRQTDGNNGETSGLPLNHAASESAQSQVRREYSLICKTGPGEGISLGALILAWGMLVDNAIVVVEGILVNIQRGAALRKPQFSFVQTAR